jgi:pseudouridine kinase
MNDYVVCVGTSNVDVQGSAGPLVNPGDKNPGGAIEVWAGGVARNIAENLARLGLPVKMLTAVGDDVHAGKIVDDSMRAGIDMSHVLKLANRRSGACISISDSEGDLFVGLTDMSIAAELTVPYFESKQAVLDGAAALVLSPCVSSDVIGYLCRHFEDRPIFVDVVSKGYVPRLREHLGRFHTVKANLPEAEELTGAPIAGEADLERAADVVLAQGVQRVVISLGKDGLFTKDHRGRAVRRRTKEVRRMTNATGAGDALAAGLVYGHMKQLALEEMLEFAMTVAILTITHRNTINPELTEAMVLDNIKEWTL